MPFAICYVGGTNAIKLDQPTGSIGKPHLPKWGHQSRAGRHPPIRGDDTPAKDLKKILRFIPLFSER